MRSRWTHAFLALAMAGCGGARGGGATTGASAGEEVVETSEELDEGPQPGELPACAAWNTEEADPMRRWLPAFPIERGGIVLTFTGMSAQQMEVEAAMEMRGVAGYEAVACGSGVVLWVPGFECEGDEQGLIDAVEEGTSMRHYGLDCFRLDEVRPRLAEECARGIIPRDRCP